MLPSVDPFPDGASMTDLIRFVVNGVAREAALEPDRSLLMVLRDELGLTGAKPGCGEGACGACTVLLDGAAVLACQARASDAAGRSVTTVEGLAPEGNLHPVQRAFVEVGALQCGYCTAGMIIRTVALLGEDAHPDDARIRAALSGNICRCGTYPRIQRAVHRAAELMADPDGWATAAPTTDAAEPSGGTPRPRRPWDLTRPAARDYFSVLPDGLVVVREPAPSGGWAASSGAWLHVAADGVVTAFTGKVDVGQDNRTALSMRVAEELRVPLTSVRLVMGDTDVCPFDVGTFGSRSMADAGEQLRRVAASARELLVGVAAAAWTVDAATLVAADGRVRGAKGGPTATYGDLVRGRRQVEVASGDTSLMPGPARRPAGRRGPRRTAPEIVTGAQRYPSDLSRPGMLHGRALRPPAPGATLRSVDLAKTAAMPGVTAVHEGAFVGVVAPDPFRAGRALRAVEAEWERVLQPSEAGLGEYLRAHPVDAEGWEGTFHQETGDVDRALAAAPVTLAATYTTAYIAHASLETHVALAEWGDDGRLTVWCGTQVPFGLRRTLSEALQVPEADVRVVVPDTGGGFGGKHAQAIATDAARLARAAGHPVKVRWNREEEFTAGHLRPAALIDIRSGALTDGTLTAWEMRNTNSGMFGLIGPYEVPHQRLDYQPADSPLAQGSYRALAATANHFARESHVDELAGALGVDALAFRLRHLRDERLATAFRTAAERLGWGAPHEPGVGLGIAGGIEKGARVATAVEVRVDDDRHLEIRRIVTAFDCGAIVDPDGLTNQVEGATVMGLGGALFEAIHFADGRILNASLTDYRVPRITDVPPIEVVLIDRRDLPSAGGGETPIIAIAPALANAIFAATGVRLRSMPLVPDGVIPETVVLDGPEPGV